MIHSFEEKKQSSMEQTDFSVPMSDEQIARLIAEVEGQEMLPAPVHLKENVLGRVRRLKRVEREKKLFSYRAQVLVTVAASLTVLLLIPSGKQQTVVQGKTLEQMAQIRQENRENDWQKYQKQEERKWENKEKYTIENMIAALLEKGGLSDEK